MRLRGAVGWVVLITACSGDSASGPDGGTDGGVSNTDAGTDATADGGGKADAGIDAGREAGADAASDAANDAGSDAGGDGGGEFYTTNFPLTENPVAESGHWVGGQSAGGNLWGDVQTTPGLAFGVTEPTQFGDPTAVLTGTWGATQTAKATVKIVNTPTGSCCHEAEVRLRMTITANNISGYEVYCSVMPDNPYCHIARWNGPNGSYCNIEPSSPSMFLADGDVIEGTASGANPVVVTGYKNGVQIMQVSDTGANCSPGGAAGPWPSGNPGIGFYDNTDNNWSDFGFSSFTATGSP